jgi:CRP/FNR family nitrogen fixation transcriptional regulator
LIPNFALRRRRISLDHRQGSRVMPTQSSLAAQGNVAAIGPGDVIEFGANLSLRGVRMHFDRNAEIFGEGEPADYVYRVVSGAVRTMRFTEDGRRQILGFHLPGDIFGLETELQHTLSAEAVSGAEIIMVRRSCLDKAVNEDMAAARALLALTAQQLSGARAHALVLGRKGAGERVAAFLLQLADRLVSKRELDLPMSRADIADYLGLTIETVSRAFSEFERQCAIGLPSSRHVVMRNPSALMQYEAAA